MSERKSVLFAASEVAPFAKTGGLADVLGYLPRALARRGHRCAVIMPLYNSVRAASLSLEPLAHQFTVPIGLKQISGRLWRSRVPLATRATGDQGEEEIDVPVFFVEQAGYFGRDDPAAGKGLYQYKLPVGSMQDYEDNAARFAFFSRAVLEAVPHLQFQPDIIHCNDWQTALIPVYLREQKPGFLEKPGFSLRTLFTIHNLAFQGMFSPAVMPLTGLDWRLYNWRQLEFHSQINYLKAGIVFADALSTVSPRYALEIQTPEYGCGLDGVLRQYQNKLVGIVNGVDYEVWNPDTDPNLAARYDVESVEEGKAACKAALQQRLGLPQRPKTPIIAVISRLTEQKGWDLIQATAVEWLSQDVQFVTLGMGEPAYHQFLVQLSERYRDKVAAAFAFDEALAHQMEAGADLFLMPSRFEPSGLNQLYSLRYGTVPLVRATGGLCDTVVDCTPTMLEAGTPTGFAFVEYTPAALLATLHRALWMYRSRKDQWRRLQQNGMRQDWSWDRRAEEYEALYARLITVR